MSKQICRSAVRVWDATVEVSTIRAEGRYETAIRVGGAWSDGIRTDRVADARAMHDTVCDIVRGYRGSDEYSLRCLQVRNMAADCFAD